MLASIGHHLRRLVAPFVVALLLVLVVIAIEHLIGATSPLTIIIPPVAITTSTTEVVVAIAEVIIAVAVIVGEVLPFLLKGWNNTIKV